MGQIARTRRSRKRGVSATDARQVILELPGVEEGRSYGMPAFKVAGKFLARFRDHDEVLVIRLSALEDRDVLMQLDPKAFFFTDHYRDYPAVLVRLAEIRSNLLAEVLEDARQYVASSASAPSRKPRKSGQRVTRGRR
jgi:hypothetical protein